MNDQQRAAMQMALEALEEICDCPQWVDEATVPKDGIEAAPHQVVMNMSVALVRLRKARKAITTLREALAQPQDNLNCKSVQARLATSWGYVKAQPQDHSEQHLNMVQDLWVDLTDAEIALAVGSPLDEVYLSDFRAVIAKFKEKNTMPVVSQGEPVACNCQELERLAEEAECVAMCLDDAGIPKDDGHGNGYSLWGRVCRYAESTIPPAIEATKEKAAKVCDDIAEAWPQPVVAKNCAAAIREAK